MKCIAIDDEPVALSVISQFAKRMDDLEVKVFSDPVVGQEEIKRIKPTLVFLDVEMEGVLGTDLAKELPAGTFLIFTTAYSEYAIDGFELNAVDFLHKPFSFQRFKKAVEKTKELLALKKMANEPEFNDEEITVKSEYKTLKIRLADIIYIEAMDNYVKIYNHKGSPILSQMSMKGMMELLPGDKFIRIHKSYIVPLYRIASYTKTQIVLHEKSISLPIGRTYSDLVFSKMEDTKKNNI